MTMHKSWFSLLVALLKDRNLGQLAAHPVMRQPGVSVVNDLEMHMLPLLLSCTLTTHQILHITRVHSGCDTMYCARAKSLHAMLHGSWEHTMNLQKNQAASVCCYKPRQGSQIGRR